MTLGGVEAGTKVGINLARTGVGHGGVEEGDCRLLKILIFYLCNVPTP